MTTAKQMALDALKLSSLQNGCDMLLTSEELRECENAIAALETELAAPQAEDIAADLSYAASKDSGGPQRDNDARALRLQQRYSRLCLPEGFAS